MTKTTQKARRITLERTYRAAIDDVWDLWTTEEGIESWWGPGGFTVRVLSLDFRPGGELHYAMTASAPAQIEFMKNAGMPLTTEARLTYKEITPKRRLVYASRADFVPNIEPYDVETVVELFAVEDRVRMLVTLDAMHDDEWTRRSVMGHESQLEKLAALLASST